MAGRFRKNTGWKTKAYTLAEVLIVMTVITLIMLALPPVTKKVFKIKDTRSPHGRYECYWKEGAKGKELWSYMYTDSGISEEKKQTHDYCEFKPSKNAIYYIMHAVGGGGAGAIIADVDISNGGGSITTQNLADLEPKQIRVQTTSYLAASNPNAWTPWVTWLNNNKPKSTLPWADSSTKTGLKDAFDVETIDDKQVVRYRLSGAAGNTVSTFLPELPRGVVLRLKPGKGGDLNAVGYGDGKPGKDTTIEYIYAGQEPIEAIRATGGRGGSGSIDSKVTYSLVGGPATDFGLSKRASIQEKLSGFKDSIETVEGASDVMKTKVPSNAGDSGRGETQFVKETDGSIMYEYDANRGLTNVTRRLLSDWKVISDKLGTTYFKPAYFTTEPKCKLETLSGYIEVSREGYCDYDEINSTDALEMYKCAIGKVPASVLNNVASPSVPSYGGGSDWTLYTLTYDYLTGAYNVLNNNSAPYSYPNYSSKFYNCKFKDVFTCKERVQSPKVWNCEKTSGGKCANGLTAKTRKKDKSTYGSGSNDFEMKCPASGGGDGAVVILW